MRISEISQRGDPQQGYTALLGALELMRKTASDQGTPPVIPMDDFIRIVKQPGTTFDYNTLVTAYKNVPAIKNLIKSFNRDQVVLTSADGEEEFTTDGDNVDVDLGLNTVARMAHKALSKRK
jgi:hypothetical protein